MAVHFRARWRTVEITRLRRSRLLEVSRVSTHLGDLLDEARRHSFVGRRRELASFDDALAGRSPRRVLFVHGQGGHRQEHAAGEFHARARGGRP